MTRYLCGYHMPYHIIMITQLLLCPLTDLRDIQFFSLSTRGLNESKVKDKDA